MGDRDYERGRDRRDDERRDYGGDRDRDRDRERDYDNRDRGYGGRDGGRDGGGYGGDRGGYGGGGGGYSGGPPPGGPPGYGAPPGGPPGGPPGYGAPPPGPPGGGALPEGALTEREILSLIERRNNAKMSRDFDTADAVRDELQRNGINVDDRAKEWTSRDGRRGEIPEGGGFARGDKKLEDGSLSWENTIYVSGLPGDVTVDDVVSFFGQIGAIKKSKKNFNMGEPTVHLYKDKRTGRMKGDGTISFEEAETAQSACKWYDGNAFMNRPGQKMSVSIAKRPAADRFGKGKGKGKGKGY